ncbi:hypothetical protein [uncultured Thalassospira sp.]|uniref:hypothetical protein n=1 Tax=uncultured Thalassospira sp. TaxID=404382 RepID=UPI0032B18FED|tara:strand:- start:15840 stop:16655 length:816 start_codon:yes stop_codon:yes gene_type:complete
MSIKNAVWAYAPLLALKGLCYFLGGFRSKEKLGLIARPWYAYGLLSAADHAKKVGLSEIWALEFGVASGRGLRNLSSLAQAVSRITGIQVRVVGFDTGAGMPASEDYRDHPEKYRAGDYPMNDFTDLKAELQGKADLVIGDISETIDEFRDSLTLECPVGFVAIDVDTYTSSKAALRLFDRESSCFLPMTWCYFDDCTSRSHFTKFTGELASIEEFNQLHDMKKIDVDRGVWNAHRRLGPQLWYERMFIMHCFDHEWRKAKTKRAPKLLRP